MTDRIEVITSVERRRRWTSAEKGRLVAASLEAGAGVSAIAREAGIHPSQLYGWRRQLRSSLPAAAGFAAVRVAAEGTAAPGQSVAAGMIDIEFASGTRMRITGPVDASTIQAMITALAKAKRQ
jgi:transposase